MSARKHRQRRLPAGVWIGALLLLALALRLAWIAYTHYVEEDAFISFRIARQISQGNGFVYNLGERVDGTTTPLFTLLLAGWLKLGADVILGARILDLAFALGSLLLVWQTLKCLRRPAAEGVAALVLLGISSKLVAMDVQGMEMPLVLFLMAASWYAVARGRAVWAGVLGGLLLWTRLDPLLWPVVLAAALLPNWKSALRMVLAAAVTLLPWVLFSTLYFGSPIPHTITAKWVAYIQFDRSPLFEHFLTVVRYLSLYYVPKSDWRNTLLVLASLALAAVGALRARRDRLSLVLPVFAVLDTARLSLTRATFESRYFVPCLWAILILAGMAAGHLWEQSQKWKPVGKASLRAAILLAALAAVPSILVQADGLRRVQIYRDEQALKAIGIWLHQHTAPGVTVELEPLGYIGYYADRTMLDEVGLVTPAVVALKRNQVPGDRYFLYLQPDFLVLHCDDALRMQGRIGGHDTGLATAYLRVEQFNPLNFDPAHLVPSTPDAGLMRSSCYEIWQRK